MTNNVVMFPKSKKNSPPQTMEELLETVESTRKEHAEYLIDGVFSFVFSRCYDEGFDLNSDTCMKSTAMLIETFRAALYGAVGVHHPLHDVAEEMFISEEDVEAVMEKLNLDLDNDDVEE